MPKRARPNINPTQKCTWEEQDPNKFVMKATKLLHLQDIKTLIPEGGIREECTSENHLPAKETGANPG